MSFVGKSTRASLGPRGRNVLQQTGAMGYVPDDHAHTRGPGAIAALDAVSPRRRQARMQQLAADQRRDAARARVAMGAVPVLPRVVASAVKKTLLPGMKIASAIRPGSVQTSKYPGMPGYRPQPLFGPGSQGVTFGAKVMSGRVFPGAPQPKVFNYAVPAIFGVRQTGTTSPGQISIPGTTPGTTSQPFQNPVDTSSGGGGGGGDGSVPGIDDGGGDLMPTNIDTSSPDSGFLTEPDQTVSQIASQTTPAPGPVDTTTPAPSNTTRNWLLAGAALLGAYWLFKKH